MLSADRETERRNLEQLLRVFGSQLSPKHIASAYRQSKGNIDVAANILRSRRTLSNIAGASEDKTASPRAMQLDISSGLENSSAASSELSSDSVLKNSCYAASNATSGALKSKKYSASVGIVSNVKSRPLTKVSSETAKPWKMDLKDFPVLKARTKEASSSAMTTGNVTRRFDIEEFLSSMFEGGFQLDETVIQQVLGSCGQDLQKSVDKLIDLCASSLEKHDDVVGIVAKQFMEKCPVEGSFSAQELSVNEDEDDENSIDVLRQAVKEYWNTMREYYKAASYAFVEGDKSRAQRLIQHGHFFNKKAREADQKSTQKIFKGSSRGDDETMYLDLRSQDESLAVYLLRVHLTSISGIPTITYLKLIEGTDDEDYDFRVRKQMLIKLLEKESINWTEKDNGRTMIVRVDEINPKSLSFAKNKKVDKRFP